VRRADRIIVLVDGTIAEDGTHEELLARNGEYNRLYMIQALEERDGEEQNVLQ
jgi:ABC-type multidrug transport system fused ATPase/permease subunit